MNLNYVRKLFAYDDWANREALNSLKTAAKPGKPPARSLKLMGHIIGVEWLWYSRLLLRKEKVMAVWPELSLEVSEKQLVLLTSTWRDYLGGLTPEKLAETVDYVNSKKESWKNSVGDVLMHVILHSSYHRGQIASDVRSSGHQPAYTDFIEAVRKESF
jgi:uncharacterized damage-inducible protein DinB